MRTFLFSAWLGIAAMTGFAQSTFQYSGNVFGCDGSACSGQLYWGPAGITDPLSPQLLASGAPFSIPTSGHYMGTATIPGPAPGTTITLQARAWIAVTGPNWETATVRGVSSPIQFLLGPGPTPQVVFPAFSVPEPSGIELAGIGALVALMMLVRPRGNSWRA